MGSIIWHEKHSMNVLFVARMKSKYNEKEPYLRKLLGCAIIKYTVTKRIQWEKTYQCNV